WHDTVIVYPHTYYENIDFLGKAITVKSINPQDPNIVAGTVIDAGGSGSAVTFENGEGPDAVITGFTITGGSGNAYGRGGGICCSKSEPMITNCTISGNSVPGYGGGVYCHGNNSPRLIDCTISGNSALLGSGIHCRDSSATIIRNIIMGNEGDGIGTTGVSSPPVTIANSIIAANQDDGCDIAGNVIIVNSLMCDNSSHGIHLHGNDAHAVVSNSVIWGNLDPYWQIYQHFGLAFVTYSNIQDGFPGKGNISLNPMFVDAGAGDYHLQAGSPCINAGDPEFVPEPGATDIDGESRVMGMYVDMGVDEYTDNIWPVADAGPDRSMSTIPAQITLDGSGSYDPEGATLTYHWEQTHGPVVEIADANSAVTAFSPTGYGAYVFELVVNNGFVNGLPDAAAILIDDGYVPVADAGLPRYAGTDPVQLDGTGSYDPDNSGPLSYQWQQISGPVVTITAGNTATPAISGFAPTNLIQRCEFELVVNDGQYSSLPDTVSVIIVHAGYATCPFRFESGSFDPEKPTLIALHRGDSWSGGSAWTSKANIMSGALDFFGMKTDIRLVGDNIITYLSSVAPDYKNAIQVTGGSGGGNSALKTAVYLNQTYADRRYAVNRATIFDSRSDWLNPQFLASSVDEEQCWVDSHSDAYERLLPGALNIVTPFVHCGSIDWYKNSLTYIDLNRFTSPVGGPGVVAGSYWSLVGPGKNLQLSSTPQQEFYKFEWYGNYTSGYMDFYDEASYPGRLPEPVTLMVAGPTTGPNPAPGYLTCEESENAVGYQLLFGSDPYRVADYIVISDTPTPPTQVITTFPFERTYWTIKARDQYGSTIYADPVHISSFILTRPIENLSTGKRYGYIQHAINEAGPGDEIVAKPGTYYESFDFKGRELTLRSTDPNDPAVVAATIISGDRKKPVVTFSGSDAGTCVLAGF
ncbi:MAG: PKD domain-containing protein, partial [Planctomycetota bacterium]